MDTPSIPPGHALVLRTCTSAMTGIHDHPKARKFVWPEAGPVSCKDWKPKAECGNGLHGLLWGEGDGSTLSWAADAKWLVVAVPVGTWIELDRKVKFPAGEVVFCGDRRGATDYLQARAPGRQIVGATATAGYAGTATAGYAGTATAGDAGTATAGYAGTATAGDDGTATAGARGTATAGARGTATAGARGTATAGDDGTATAGDDGILNVRWWDGKRYRIATMYVGEDGIEPNQPYKVDEKGRPMKVSKKEKVDG